MRQTMRLLLSMATIIASAGVAQAADAVTISILVATNTNPPIGVPARIFRKTATTGEHLATDTDDSGKAVLTEQTCSADIQYRAEALALIRFPRGRIRWESCRITGQIIFLVVPSGVSRRTENFLERTPDDWVVPEGYEPLFEELRKAVTEENWGPAVKLSSQLADQYRSANLSNEASIFSEIALAGTANVAASQYSEFDFSGPLLDSDGIGGAYLSQFAKKAVADFQTSCGLKQDGVVGWRTMNCLPGGSGYTLPDVAVVPFEQLAKPNI